MAGIPDMLLGIGTNYLSGELLENLAAARDRKAVQALEDSLFHWELDFERAHDGTIASSGEFFGCVKHYRVIERVLSYVLAPSAEGPGEEAFLAEVRRGMAEALGGKYQRELTGDETAVLDRFLGGLLEQVKRFAAGDVPPEDRFLLYSLCQSRTELSRFEASAMEQFGLTRDAVERLTAKVDKILEKREAGAEEAMELPEEFDGLIRRYNDILAKSQRKVKVYSWDDLDFESVYVPPSLEVHFHPLIVGETMYGGFWKYDAASEGGGAWIRPDLMLNYTTYVNMLRLKEGPDTPKAAETLAERRGKIRALFSLSSIVYIIGGAGCGKSLFLKNLCVNPSELEGYGDKPLLVLRGDLKRLIRPDGTFRPMREYLEECFAHASLQKPDEVCPGFLERCLRAGRCLVLLDALDEVGNDQREELHQRVVSYFQGACAGNKVCITSRARGFIPEKNVTCFSILPISIQNAGEYVDRFISLGKFPAEEKARFLKQAESLVNKGFVKGFLTLSLLMAIYRNEEELPANKVALYEKCFEYIANAREKSKRLLHNSSTGEEYDWSTLGKLMGEATFMELARLGTPNNKDIPRRQIDRLMASLYQNRFQSRAECAAAVEVFLQFCADRTEVFVPSPSSNTEYRFFHRSFYEFFYANHIKEETRTPEETYEKLWDFDVDSELFELLVAMYGRNKPAYLRSLLQYAFEQSEAQLQEPDSGAARTIDILILLMQTADENDFTERFIRLFLERGSAIAKLETKTGYYLINQVFMKNRVYFEGLFRESQKVYLLKMERELAQFLIGNRAHWSDMLKRGGEGHWFEWKMEPSERFRYMRLLMLLYDQTELMEQMFKDLKAPQHVYALGVRGKSGAALSSFVKQVLELPVKRQTAVYSEIALLI